MTGASEQSPPHHLTAASFERAGQTVVALAGELDLASAPVAEQALQNQVDVLDLSGLEFMDSAGVRIVVRVCRDCKQKLIIYGARRAVRQTLELTGLSKSLVFEDARDATDPLD
jgi:anti-anti-sigma factor